MRILALVMVVIVVAACGSTVVSHIPSPSAGAPANGSAPSTSAAASSPIAGVCNSTVDMGVLPTWARAGFSDPEPALPHVMSRSSEIVAILFGYPLSSPPRANINNKILWVLQGGPTSPVAISAQRMDGATRVGAPVARRLDGGFGPSIVDLPDAGCWRLALAFADRTDTIDLEYVLPGGLNYRLRWPTTFTNSDRPALDVTAAGTPG
jgi:hypothetical protein